MDFIANLFNLDFSVLVPEISMFLGGMRTLLILAILAGPIAMTVLGYFYLFRPTPEANYRFGFRTYYGMGSIEAWQFSQKIAGLIFGALGAALLLIMLVVILATIKQDLLHLARTAVICLLCQAGLALIARLTVAILAAVFFDGKGNHRK